MAYSLELERKFELRDPVTPYVCSTPADFEEERDWLSDNTFPQLAELCLARGTYFSPVDVRWSEEDSSTQEGHLLGSLLELVTKSCPYFLCLLGECYGPYLEGSLPSTTTNDGDGSEAMDWVALNLTMAAQNGHQWVMQDGHQNCSIPELEIIAATFRGDSQQCTFYFRQAEHLDIKFQSSSARERAEYSAKFLAENELAGLKIQGLKHTIVKRGLPVRYFKSPQELGQIVLEDWIAILDTVCPPLYNNGQFLDTAHYQQWIAREALLSRLRSGFVQSEVTDTVVEDISRFVLTAIDEHPQVPEADQQQEISEYSKSATNIFRQKPPPPPPYQNILLLGGDRGVGKSMVLAQWLQEFAEENPGIYLIPHFIGAAPGDADIAAFLRRCTRDLRKHFLLTEVTGYAELDDSSSWWSEEDMDTPEHFHTLCQAFVAALSLGPCILLLDGVNDMSATAGLSQQEVKEFDWLPSSLPHHCRLVFSTSRSDLTYRCLCRRGDVKVMTLPGVKDRSCKMSLLAKTLKPHVMPLVQNKQKLICDMRFLMSSLALCVMGTEMNMPSVYLHLEQFVDTHCETTTLRAFWTYCLQQWVTQYSWTRDDDASIASKDDGMFDYTGWVADALCLLTVSRGGLRQNEVLQLLRRMGYVGSLEVTVLHWLRFRLRAGSLLWETSDGRIRFSHKHLQDITEYTLLRTVSDEVDPKSQAPHQHAKRKIHLHLSMYFGQQSLSWRQAQELPWHLMMCGDVNGLLSYLTHSRVVHLFLAKASQYPDALHDLQMYWTLLEKENEKAKTRYLTMLKCIGLYTLPAAVTAMESSTEKSAVHHWLDGNPTIAVSEEKEEATVSESPVVRLECPRPGSSFQAWKTIQPGTDTMATIVDGEKLQSHDTQRHQVYSSSRKLNPALAGRVPSHYSTAQNQPELPTREITSYTPRSNLFPDHPPSSADVSRITLADDTECPSTDKPPGIRPSSSPCSYRLSVQVNPKKEAHVLDPSSRASIQAVAKRKVSSAPGKRSISPVKKIQSSLSRPQSATQTAQSNKGKESTVVSKRKKSLTLQEKLQMKAIAKGRAFRPFSAPQSKQRSQVLLTNPPSLSSQKPALSSVPMGVFLTSSETNFNMPDVLDGVDLDRQKDVIAELSFAVGRFLQGMGETETASLILSSLLTFLQASYPLVLSTHILLVRVLESLGSLCCKEGDMEGASQHYHHALRVTFDLDALEDDLCDHRQVDTFKGVLLGHHGSLRMQEGDVLEGGELLKEATESISHLTGNHALRASLLFHLGLYRGQLGELTRSETSLRQCLALRQQWHGQLHPEVASVLLALARVLNTIYRLKHNDQRQEAEGLYRKALVVSERCLGTAHLQVADILVELGELVAEEEGRMAKMEARKLLQRSLDIRTTALGADDASTKAARGSVRRVELSLQLGGQTDALSSRPEHIAIMPQRDMRLPHMGSRTGAASRTGGTPVPPARAECGSLDIRSVSREKVLLHNRPDSMMSSAFSLMSASERLLASRPLSSTKGKGSRASSALGGRTGGSMSVGWSAKSAPVEVRLDLDQEEPEKEGQVRAGRRALPGTSTPRDAEGQRRAGVETGRTVMLDLDLGQVNGVQQAGSRHRYDATGDADTDGMDTPHLDSFAVHLQDGTIIIGEEPARTKVKKRVKVRPHSTPQRLFEHYASVATTGGVTGKPKGQQKPAGADRRTWSARTTASSVGSHVSRCSVPGPHDIHPGNTKSLSGPHSDILSLLGPPVCPRDNVHPEVHHRSAFYHVPGRYPTRMHSYPSRRCQKTEGARVLQSVMAIKMAQAGRVGGGATLRAMTYSPTPRQPGVNQHDVTMLVRQTGVNRPECRAGVILSSARAPPDPSMEKAYPTPAVKFREPITVS